MTAAENLYAELTRGVAHAQVRQHLIDAHRAEVLAEAAPPCAVCETPIEWVACPTGGWWAHHTHPADEHDAQPPGTDVPALLAEVARLRARLAAADLPPSGRPSAEEYRLEQYAQPPRTFESSTERALFEIAIGLRQVLADTRRRRDDARAGREDAEARVEELEQQLAAEHARGLLDAAEIVDNDDDCGCGGCDSCVPRRLAAQVRERAAGGES